MAHREFVNVQQQFSKQINKLETNLALFSPVGQRSLTDRVGCITRGRVIRGANADPMDANSAPRTCSGENVLQ